MTNTLKVNDKIFVSSEFETTIEGKIYCFTNDDTLPIFYFDNKNQPLFINANIDYIGLERDKIKSKISAWSLTKDTRNNEIYTIEELQNIFPNILGKSLPKVFTCPCKATDKKNW